MKKLSFLLGCLFIFTSSTVLASSSKHDVLKGYFKYFNYNKIENQSTSFEIEDQLLILSQQIENQINSVNNSDQKLQMSLILVYTAMYLLNNNNGAIEGVIDLETLTKKHNISSTDNLRVEIIERYKLADRYLSIALKTTPEDERIESWYLANLLRWQKYEKGVVEEYILDRITELSKEAPMFHLFNALTMESDYSFGEQRGEKLFELVELMTGKDSPCKPFIKFLRKGEAKKCNTTKKTPYAYQGTSVYLGDAYLKRYLKIKDTEPDLAAKHLGKAQGIYYTAKYLKIFKTRKWSLKKNLNNRLKVIKNLRSGNSVPEGFFKSREYLDIYTCNSCHEGGKKSNVLNLKTLEGVIE